jgi:hypothetical protein
MTAIVPRAAAIDRGRAVFGRSDAVCGTSIARPASVVPARGRKITGAQNYFRSRH